MSRVLAVLVLVAMAGSPLAAQPPAAQPPTPDVRLFEEADVRIKGPTKMDIPLSKAPGSITVITAQQIRESNARTIPEVLRLVAGVNVRWNPMVQTIDMRGFGENPFTSRVLLLIDGVPYNAWDKGGFPQHPSLDFFVIQNIKRLEVIRGPGSALYGENAYWGVINIVTLAGEDLQGGQVEAFGGSRETGSVGTYYGRRFRDASMFVSGKFTQSQFPIAFWADENDSNVRGSDIFVKVSRRGLQASYYRHDDSVDGFEERFPPEVGFPPGAVFRSVDNISQSVDILALKYDRMFTGRRISVGGDVSFARRVGTHCAACHASAQGDPHFEEKANHGHQVIGDVRVGLHMIPSHTVLVGMEARQVAAGDHVDELGVPPGSGARLIDKYWKPAFYVQDQISLAGDRVQVYGGLRYDGKNDLSDDKLSPRIAVVFNPSARLVLRGGWSTAFRFPNFSELYQNSWFLGVESPFGAFPIAVFDPNPFLKPEEIRTFEVSGEYRFTPQVSAKVDLFRSLVKNFMVLTFPVPPAPAPALVRYQNHPDEATIAGIETEMRWAFPGRISGFVNYSYQTEDQKGNLTDDTGRRFEFVYAPANKVNVGAYAGPFRGVRGTVELQWKGEYTAPGFWYLIASNFTDPTIRPFDAYALLNTRVSYDLPFGDRARPLRLSLYLKNLLDQRPRETLVGVDTRLTGREFFGGLTVGF